MSQSQDLRMDLKVDYAFKQMFGQPQNAELLIDFLNALFKQNERERIVSVTFPNTELTAETFADKEARLDVFAVTDAEERINIEIQLTNHRDMAKRSLYYWASLFRSQAKSGMKYRELNRTITVNILDFHYFDSTPVYHSTYHLLDDKTQMPMTDVMEIHFIELPKLRKSYQDNLAQAVQDPLERWLLLLDAADNEQIRLELEALAMKDPIMEKAMEAWAQISRDPDNWAAYLARHMEMMDRASWLAEAREEGMEEGIKLGREEGKLETILEIARNFLLMNHDVSEVANATGLSVAQVEEIKRQLH